MDKLFSYNFLKSHRAIVRFMNSIFLNKKHLTVTQMFALWAVHSNQGGNLTSISKALSMDRTTLFRTLDRLKDFIIVEKKGHDNRSLALKLTPKGKDLVESLSAEIEARDKELCEKVGLDLPFFLKFFGSVDKSIGYDKK